MTNSFIHFVSPDLKECIVYSQNGLEIEKQDNLKISELANTQPASSRLIIFLPSSVFGFKRFENSSNLKGDFLKAVFFSEIEDLLITDISKLRFFYFQDLELGAWMDLDKYESLIESLNIIDSDVYLYPEHFLLPSNKNVFYINDADFIAATEDGDGFSGNIQFLDSFIEALKVDGIDAVSFEVLVEDKDLISPSGLNEDSKTLPLSKLRHDFFERSISSSGNIFERNFSINFFLKKLNFTKLEKSFIAATLAIIFFIPPVINFILDSSISTYEKQTEKIFKQLNPNFNQLVNPKAQIDNLTRNIPASNNLSQQNIEAIKYIERLSDESVKLVNINFLLNSITLSIENLPLYKMKLFQELLKNEPLIINSSKLINKEDALFGQLVINRAPS